MITLCSELFVSLGWVLPVLFNKGRKICFVSMASGEGPHLHFLSKLTILIFGKGLSPRIPLSHSLGHVVGKLKPSLYKIMHPMHLSRWMEHYLILGTLSPFTDNRITTHFLICRLIICSSDWN